MRVCDQPRVYEESKRIIQSSGRIQVHGGVWSTYRSRSTVLYAVAKGRRSTTWTHMVASGEGILRGGDMCMSKTLTDQTSPRTVSIVCCYIGPLKEV